MRRWRSRPETAPQRVAQTTLRLWAPFAANLLWALLGLVAPPLLGFPPKGLLLIDFGQVLLLSGALTLVWGRKTPPDHGAHVHAR